MTWHYLFKSCMLNNFSVSSYQDCSYANGPSNTITSGLLSYLNSPPPIAMQAWPSISNWCNHELTSNSTHWQICCFNQVKFNSWTNWSTNFVLHASKAWVSKLSNWGSCYTEATPLNCFFFRQGCLLVNDLFLFVYSETKLYFTGPPSSPVKS